MRHLTQQKQKLFSSPKGFVNRVRQFWVVWMKCVVGILVAAFLLVLLVFCCLLLYVLIPILIQG